MRGSLSCRTAHTATSPRGTDCASTPIHIRDICPWLELPCTPRYASRYVRQYTYSSRGHAGTYGDHKSISRLSCYLSFTLMESRLGLSISRAAVLMNVGSSSLSSRIGVHHCPTNTGSPTTVTLAPARCQPFLIVVV